ncbi:MAG: flagellar biosynthetic protein FliQ [Deltaproteobacteria bacterium]|nr:flagellar biosynthetic protein FliQ [Deltaproteobacteria bacterium]
MSWEVLVNALGLAVELSIPLVIVALVAAIVAGVLQAATQINDDVISFSLKLFLVAGALYLYSGHLISHVAEFSQRVWGGTDYYY